MRISDNQKNCPLDIPATGTFMLKLSKTKEAVND